MNPWDLVLVLLGWLAVTVLGAIILLIGYAVVYAFIKSLTRKRSTQIFRSPAK